MVTASGTRFIGYEPLKGRDHENHMHGSRMPSGLTAEFGRCA